MPCEDMLDEETSNALDAPSHKVERGNTDERAATAGARRWKGRNRAIELALHSIDTINNIEKRCVTAGILDRPTGDANYPEINMTNPTLTEQAAAKYSRRLLEKLYTTYARGKKKSEGGLLTAASYGHALLKKKFEQLEKKHHDLEEKHRRLREKKARQLQQKREQLKDVIKVLKKKRTQLKAIGYLVECW